MAITDWPEDQRPRERLQREGPDALSDAELLAIFLRVGIAGKSAVDLARDLLHRFDGSLSRLCHARLNELASVSGIGPAKAAQLQAIFTLSKRALNQQMKERDNINSPQAARDYLRLHLAHLSHEVLHGLFLDSQHRLLESRTLFRGTLTETAVYPREVVVQALQLNAAALILAHNHPSGEATPSPADIELTLKLRQALALVDVKVLDHFVIGSGQEPVSLAERGLI